MKFWAKILLSLAVIGIAIGSYYIDEFYTKKEEETKRVQGIALDFASEKVLEIHLKTLAESFVFQRKDAASEWTIVKPTPNIRPAQDAVNSILEHLKSLSIDQRISEEKNSKSDEDKYGLKNPRIVVSLKTDDKSEISFYLGNELGIGTGAVYAQSTQSSDLLVLPASAFKNLQKNFAEIRTKMPGDFNISDVQKIVIKHGDRFVLEKLEGVWNITQPKKLLADANNIAILIDRYSRGKVGKVIEKENQTLPFLKSLGIQNQPEGEVQIFGEKEKLLQTFSMGKTPNNMYITMKDGGLGEMPLSSWPEFNPDVFFLRDKKILQPFPVEDIAFIQTDSKRRFRRENADWYFVSQADASKETKTPESKVSDRDAVQFFADWEYLLAEEIIDNPKLLPIYGLDKPKNSFTFEFKSPEKNKPLKVLIGKKTPSSDKSIYIRLAGYPQVYKVDAKWLDAFSRMNGTGGLSDEKAPKDLTK